jgi:hypothetical protein
MRPPWQDNEDTPPGPETCETVGYECPGDCDACSWTGYRPDDAPEPEECV